MGLNLRTSAVEAEFEYMNKHGVNGNVKNIL
jgi:hypothetical protein